MALTAAMTAKERILIVGVGIKYVGIKVLALEVVETSEIGDIRCISVVSVGEGKKDTIVLEGLLIGSRQYTSLPKWQH